MNKLLKLFQTKWLVVLFLVFGVQVVAQAQEPSAVEGVWQTFDDKTNHKKAQVEVKFDEKSKSYYGRIIKVTPVPGYTPKTHCQNCPAPFTGKKIEGILLFWNLKPVLASDGSFKGGFDNGYLIDPLSGKIYRFKAGVSKSGRIFKPRAYVGISVIGRTQTWTRIK